MCDVSSKNKQEAAHWGHTVLQQLAQKTDLQKDEFTILAGKSYINPIKHGIKDFKEPLEGLKQGERVKHLQKLIS